MSVPRQRSFARERSVAAPIQVSDWATASLGVVQLGASVSGADVPDAVVAAAKVKFGKKDTVPAVLAAPWLLTVPNGVQVQTNVEIQPGLQAPVAKGAVIGKVVATANGKAVGESALVAQAEVERSGFLLLGWQHVMGWLGK